MSRPAIIISERDAELLDRLLEKPANASLPVAKALNEELDRATTVPAAEIPANVVTINSQVEFRNLRNGETWIRTLVYPQNLSDSQTQISVLAPVGAALLGLKEGDNIEWALPAGVSTHIEVIKVLCQPETAGDAGH